MSRWYRAYEGTVTDGKLAEAALVAGCTRSVAIAAWHCCLENAAVVNDGGRIDVPTRRIAAILCEPFDSIETLLCTFEAIGLIRDSAVSSWSRRQYESDNSTERSKKHRERKRNGDATLQDSCATPPETETETQVREQNPVANATDAAASSPIDLKAAIFASGVPLLQRTGISDRNARSMLGRWRKDHGDGAVMDALAFAQTVSPSEAIPYITRTLENRSGRQRTDTLRGSRPDPALDMWRQANAEIEAKRTDPEDYLRIGPPISSFGPS